MARETLDSNLNSTPSANRVHIAFFGKRNAGKSSVVNAVTGQELSIVSDVLGTTTDPVRKAMELLPLGPVVIIDTPGLDDVGLLGEKRIEKAYEILGRTDIGILVVDGTVGIASEDLEILQLFKEKKLPALVVYNKLDLCETDCMGCVMEPDGCALTQELSNNQDSQIAQVSLSKFVETSPLWVSAATGENINALKDALAKLAAPLTAEKKIIGDKLGAGDMVILVTPIDSSAPKGRMILPQVQAIRDILDVHATCIVTQVPELAACIDGLKNPPALVVTDSQAFGVVKNIVPESIPLTSFSIVFARYKGILDTAVAGAKHLWKLQDGDKILISEGCTHHRQCEDIGTVKLPGWIQSKSGKTLEFEFSSGTGFPRDLSEYAMVVHCGGCMLNEREMLSRMAMAENAEVPFTNYGTLIAEINGILDRSLEFLNM